MSHHSGTVTWKANAAASLYSEGRRGHCRGGHARRTQAAEREGIKNTNGQSIDFEQWCRLIQVAHFFTAEVSSKFPLLSPRVRSKEKAQLSTFRAHRIYSIPLSRNIIFTSFSLLAVKDRCCPAGSLGL